MGTGCFCHLLFFPLIIMQIGHSLQHFLPFCLFKQYFCESTWQSRPGMRVHRYNETKFIASPSRSLFPRRPFHWQPALSQGPGAAPRRVPLSSSRTELAGPPWQVSWGTAWPAPGSPSPGATSSQARWQAEQRHPRAWEAVQLSAAHRALCNYRRALMELDTLHWGLI